MRLARFTVLARFMRERTHGVGPTVLAARGSADQGFANSEAAEIESAAGEHTSAFPHAAISRGSRRERSSEVLPWWLASGDQAGAAAIA